MGAGTCALFLSLRSCLASEASVHMEKPSKCPATDSGTAGAQARCALLQVPLAEARVCAPPHQADAARLSLAHHSLPCGHRRRGGVSQPGVAPRDAHGRTSQSWPAILHKFISLLMLTAFLGTAGDSGCSAERLHPLLRLQLAGDLIMPSLCVRTCTTKYTAICTSSCCRFCAGVREIPRDVQKLRDETS